MALAKEEREMAARGKGCLGKAADDEPVFVLRAKDIFAPHVVLIWMVMLKAVSGESEKLAEARSLYYQMQEWQARTGNYKIPD